MGLQIPRASAAISLSSWPRSESISSWTPFDARNAISRVPCESVWYLARGDVRLKDEEGAVLSSHAPKPGKTVSAPHAWEHYSNPPRFEDPKCKGFLGGFRKSMIIILRRPAIRRRTPVVRRVASRVAASAGILFKSPRVGSDQPTLGTCSRMGRWGQWRACRWRCHTELRRPESVRARIRSSTWFSSSGAGLQVPVSMGTPKGLAIESRYNSPCSAPMSRGA